MSDAPKADYSAASYARGIQNDRSLFPDNAPIFHLPGHAYDPVVRLEAEHLGAGDFKTGAFQAKAILASGVEARLRITAAAYDAFRIQFGLPGDAFRERSEMLVDHPAPAWGLMVQEDAASWRLRLGAHVLVLAKAAFAMELHDGQGTVVFQIETERIAGRHTCGPIGFRTRDDDQARHAFLGFRIRNGERFVGLGEKWNAVEKTGTRATIWNTETCGSNTTDLSYKAMPVLYSTRGWGLFLHSSFRSQWEVGSFSYTGGSVLVEDGRLDLFLMAAPTLKGLVGTYTALTGRPAMPPLWAFGTWVSRCQFFTAAEAEESMRGFRELGMPADVIHLDPLWMTTHWYWKIGVDACDFEWNEAGFPDHAALFAAWRAQGWDICLWINPYLPEAKPIYAEAQAAGFLLRDVRGGIARLSHGEPVGMIDVTNPAARAWWQGRLEQLLRDGASVLKPDYGDRVPETALAHNGMTGAELHNLYLHLYAEICFEARRNVHGQPVVWRRAGYVGSQRFAGCWAGDTQTTWEAFRCCLRGGLSAGFTGDGFWSHDIGGFCGPVPSPELYIRWMQVGLLSPFARFHGNRLCEPWHYGAQAVAVAQRYTRLRYRLVPYLLACASEACATGIPIQRHCLLEFPGEPGLHALDDQILLGPDLLLLPVLEPGATSRQAYLPTGRWYDYDDPAVSYDGGRWHTIPAPLDRIPLLVREGAIIPRYAQDQQHLKEPRPAEIEVAVWPGDRPHQVRCDDGAGAVHVVRDAQGLRIAAGARPVALRTMAQ